MKIEEFEDIKIAYMRRVGKYGPENKVLMETFKSYLKEKGLIETATIFGIALDHPVLTPEAAQRYDVGVVISGRESSLELPIRNVDNGQYAIFEVEHTAKGVSDFWRSLPTLTAGLAVDTSRPIIERYDSAKIAVELCEFCVPLV